MKKFFLFGFSVSFPLIAFVLVQLYPKKAEAKIFRNAYVSFELPSRWNCHLENTAWLCRHGVSKQCNQAGAKNSKACIAQKKRAKEAIIILAAKEVGPKDHLKAYYDYLTQLRSLVTKSGKRFKSKLIHSKIIKIEHHKWVDGMHLGSEVPHYYTRYLATVKGKIAVLVTFSSHKLYYTKYSNEFFRAIKSLRVIATSADMAKRGKNFNRKNVGTFGVNTDVEIDSAIDEAGYGDGTERGGSKSDFLLIGFVFFLFVAGLYLWMRGKR